MRIVVSGLLAVSVILPACSQARAIDCGQSPAPPFRLSDEQSIKTDIAGKASLLSKYLDSGEFKGRVEASRSQIFQDAEKTTALWKDAYLSFMFCNVISESTMTPSEKIRAITEYGNASSNIPKPVSSTVVLPAKTSAETKICFGEGGNKKGDCRSGSNIQLSCDRYHSYSDLKSGVAKDFCTDLGGSNPRVSEYFNQGGGGCGWTGLLLTCDK